MVLGGEDRVIDIGIVTSVVNSHNDRYPGSTTYKVLPNVGHHFFTDGGDQAMDHCVRWLNNLAEETRLTTSDSDYAMSPKVI